MVYCAFLGDELTALGFRLAGVECHTPGPEGALALFGRLSREVQVLLISAAVAADLPPDLLRRAQMAERPLLLVIGDVRNTVPPPDRVAAVRRQLGMAE